MLAKVDHTDLHKISISAPKTIRFGITTLDSLSHRKHSQFNYTNPVRFFQAIQSNLATALIFDKTRPKKFNPS